MTDSFHIDHESFMGLAQPVYGEDWQGVIHYFKSTPHEWLRVKELMAEITDKGQLEPGRLAWDEELETYFLMNGMHRWAATHELGVDYLVTVTGNNFSESNASYNLTELTIDYASSDDDEIERIMDCFSSNHSFRLSEDQWVEADALSSVETGMGVRFEVPFQEVPWREVENLALKFLERTKCCVDVTKIEYVDVALKRSLSPTLWQVTNDGGGGGQVS